MTPRNETGDETLLGTSTPTASFPGMGARIRMLSALRSSFMLFSSEVILSSLTPGDGTISSLVILGPVTPSVTFASTPKLSNVS